MYSAARIMDKGLVLISKRERGVKARVASYRILPHDARRIPIQHPSLADSDLGAFTSTTVGMGPCVSACVILSQLGYCLENHISNTLSQAMADLPEPHPCVAAEVRAFCSNLNLHDLHYYIPHRITPGIYMPNKHVLYCTVNT